MKIEDIEASLVRYLYENLTLAYGIKVIEDITEKDPTGVAEWVTIDSISNTLAPGPIQRWFIYMSIANEAPNAKQKLNVLTDKVSNLLLWGSQITLYSYSTGEVIGGMSVSESSLSQMLTHRAGGLMRTLSVAVTY